MPSVDCMVNFPGTDVSVFGDMPGMGPVILEWENGRMGSEEWEYAVTGIG